MIFQTFLAQMVVKAKVNLIHIKVESVFFGYSQNVIRLNRQRVKIKGPDYFVGFIITSPMPDVQTILEISRFNLLIINRLTNKKLNRVFLVDVFYGLNLFSPEGRIYFMKLNIFIRREILCPFSL